MTDRNQIVFLAVLAVIAAAAFMIWRNNVQQRKWFLKKLERMWGSEPERTYTGEELEKISHYARTCGEGRFVIDDITWNDLDLDRIFAMMNTTVSSCGEDVLYRMLRIPEFDPRQLSRRNELIEYFRTHKMERIQVQKAVSRVRVFSSLSLTDYLFALKDVEEKGIGKYLLLAAMSAAALGVIFFHPMAGMLALVAVLSVNGLIRMRDNRKMGPYMNCITGILRMLHAADGFAKINNPQISEYLDRIAEARRQLKGFRRGAFLVVADGGFQDGLESLILSYLKLIFMVDFIKFYSMLRQVKGHEQQIQELFAAMGELDALIAMASFRELLPYSCLPRLTPYDSGHAYLYAKDLYHPLIKDPVANDVQMESGILITGSNASGKSTFLRTVAVNALLAQTVCLCAARSYQGSYVRVLSSMALKDNLQSGESYYIVEIRSLQRILEACRSTTPVLCIVDEVLRGTNTIERIAASSRILRSLAMPHVLLLAATHDMELSYILEDCYANYHFDEEIRGQDVIFPYQLKEGRADTRNAIKLLELIGYDAAIIRDAQEAARRFEETGVWQ